MGWEKNMKNKILLLIILFTPIAVVIASSLILFCMAYLPTNTNNNGVFFKDYFNFDQFSISNNDNDGLKFDDGKWVLAVYVTDTEIRLKTQFIL